MKITSILASRRDDIVRRRDEYDAETKKFQDQVDEGEAKWEARIREQRSALEKTVSDLIGATSLSLSIKADPWGGLSGDGWSILVRANERNKFDDTVALAWNWDVKIDRNGEIVKDSGSWSGLKAITADQIADLEESVRVLKVLNNMDWATILSSPKAEVTDFVDSEVSKTAWDRNRNRPNFEDDLAAAELEDSVGSNIAFKLDQDAYFRGDVYILVTGLTDKFVKGYIFPEYIAKQRDKQGIIDYCGEARRTSRANLSKRNGQFVTFEVRE